MARIQQPNVFHIQFFLLTFAFCFTFNIEAQIPNSLWFYCRGSSDQICSSKVEGLLQSLSCLYSDPTQCEIVDYEAEQPLLLCHAGQVENCSEPERGFQLFSLTTMSIHCEGQQQLVDFSEFEKDLFLTWSIGLSQSNVQSVCRQVEN